MSADLDNAFLAAEFSLSSISLELHGLRSSIFLDKGSSKLPSHILTNDLWFASDLAVW